MKKPTRSPSLREKVRIEADRWSHVGFKIPEPLMEALENYLWDHGRKKKVPFLRDDLIASTLIDEGYLQVNVRRDPKTGVEIRSYEAIEQDQQRKRKG